MTYNLAPLKTRLAEVSGWLSNEYKSLRTGRASPAVLDAVMVDSYGTRLPLKQVAAIAVEDAGTIRVTPWDKGQVKAIETAVAASNLGLSAVADQNGLRVVFPQLTTERRTMLAKVVKDKLEEARVRLRAEREKVWQEIQKDEKAKKINEDEKFKVKDELQKIIDTANDDLASLAAKKEAEIMA